MLFYDCGRRRRCAASRDRLQIVFELFFVVLFEVQKFFREVFDALVLFGVFVDGAGEGGDPHDRSLRHHFRNVRAGIVLQGTHLDGAPHHRLFHGVGFLEFHAVFAAEHRRFAGDLFVTVVHPFELFAQFFVLRFGQNVRNGLQRVVGISVNFSEQFAGVFDFHAVPPCAYLQRQFVQETKKYAAGDPAAECYSSFSQSRKALATTLSMS